MRGRRGAVALWRAKGVGYGVVEGEEMTDNTLAQLTGNLLSDALTLLGIPTNTAIEVFRRHLKAKIDEARDILLEELRSGNVDSLHVASEDEAISIVYRYALAARDGAARRNLRLLGKTIVSLAVRDRLYSDEFNKFADILAHLTRDQILVLGRLYALFREEEQTSQDNPQVKANVWKRLQDELVPSQFPTADHITVICSQATGSGLMIAASAYGGLAYRLSPLMDEIAELADFQDTLRAEGEMPEG